MVDDESGVREFVAERLELGNEACTSIDGLAWLRGLGWHRARAGNYSMYSAAVANQSSLRGVHATDENGTVTLTKIVPACCSGRWPHIRIEG